VTKGYVDNINNNKMRPNIRFHRVRMTQLCTLLVCLQLWNDYLYILYIYPICLYRSWKSTYIAGSNRMQT